MQIAALVGSRTFAVQEVPTPVPRPGEVLVQVAACGVCASDVETWNVAGETASYPGHEVSGTVVELGDGVAGLEVGTPVGCWVTSHGFAEYVAVPAVYCRPVRGVPLDVALAEPLACAANAVELADVRLADDVVLVGAGFMGTLVQQLVGLRGARQLVVADTRADAVQRAESLGVTRAVHVPGGSLADVVAGLTDGRGADVTFECTGTQAGLDTVGEVTRMSGKVVLVGYHQGAPRQISLAGWNWMAYDIRNAHFRDVATIMRGMTVGMRLVESGAVDLAPLVTHRFDLDRINDALAAAEERAEGFVKAVITF